MAGNSHHVIAALAVKEQRSCPRFKLSPCVRRQKRREVLFRLRSNIWMLSLSFQKEPKRNLRRQAFLFALCHVKKAQNRVLGRMGVILFGVPVRSTYPGPYQCQGRNSYRLTHFVHETGPPLCCSCYLLRALSLLLPVRQ